MGRGASSHENAHGGAGRHRRRGRAVAPPHDARLDRIWDKRRTEALDLAKVLSRLATLDTADLKTLCQRLGELGSEIDLPARWAVLERGEAESAERWVAYKMADHPVDGPVYAHMEPIAVVAAQMRMPRGRAISWFLGVLADDVHTEGAEWRSDESRPFDRILATS
jgi:hypothetical protein